MFRDELQYIVFNPSWTDMSSSEPMAVLLLHWTANVYPDGVVHFYRDVYRRDPPIAEVLDGPFRIG